MLKASNQIARQAFEVRLLAQLNEREVAKETGAPRPIASVDLRDVDEDEGVALVDVTFADGGHIEGLDLETNLPDLINVDNDLEQDTQT